MYKDSKLVIWHVFNEDNNNVYDLMFMMSNCQILQFYDSNPNNERQDFFCSNIWELILFTVVLLGRHGPDNRIWSQGGTGNRIFGDAVSQAATASATKKSQPPGVNFINILCRPFLYKSVLRSFFLVTVQFGFVIFWGKNIGAKAVPKMLMKMTPPRRQIIFRAT